MKQCVAASTGIKHHSNDWYVDWKTNLCLRDCDPKDHPRCGGNPEDPWDTFFPTARECCQTRLSWVNEEYCVGESTGVAYNPPDTYNPPYTPPDAYTPPYTPPDAYTPPTPPDAYTPPDGYNAPTLKPVSTYEPPTPDYAVVPKPTYAYPQCFVDSDCQAVCNYDGTCKAAPGPAPTSNPLEGTPTYNPLEGTPTHNPLERTNPPVDPVVDEPTTCTCTEPKNVPDKCELQILIDLLEVTFSGNTKFFAQALRLAFHEAGTFDQRVQVGGALGCTMTNPLFLEEPENDGLQDIVMVLKVSGPTPKLCPALQFLANATINLYYSSNTGYQGPMGCGCEDLHQSI